jgi:hypothetical protein
MVKLIKKWSWNWFVANQRRTLVYFMNESLIVYVVNSTIKSVGDKFSQRMNNKELRTLRKKTRTMNKT